MLNIIIKAIFWIIGKIGDIILIPITSVINLLVPNLSINFNAIFDYIQMGFSYIPFILKFLMIPSVCISLVVFVFTTYLSLILGIRGYHFIMRIYEKFKP